MKKLKVALRAWIAAVSVTGFIFGWATFAHSSKPASLAIVSGLAATTTLDNSGGSTSNVTVLVPATTSSTNNSITALQILPQTRLSASPRLRTGGS